jgi:hypothetical protein
VPRRGLARKTWLLPFSRPSQLDFVSDCSSVTVLPTGDLEPARLEVDRADDLDVQVSLADRRVRVRVMRGRRGRRRRRAHVALHVPRDLVALVRAHGGSVEARDLGPCDMCVDADVGRISLSNVYGRLRLVTGAGQIIGRGIGGSLQVAINAGAVDLEILDLVAGRHQIDAGAGSVEIGLARDLDLRLDLRSARGLALSTFRTRPAAAAELCVAAHTGSIVVKETRRTPIRQPVERPHPLEHVWSPPR